MRSLATNHDPSQHGDEETHDWAGESAVPVL